MEAETRGQLIIRLHSLTFVTERDGVMVGRPDTGSYALFPREGAELLQRLQKGESLESCGKWYADDVGASLDFDHLRETLLDLGFVLGDEEIPYAPVIRWQRFARWVFSPPAWIVYIAITLAGVVAMVSDPGLRPNYSNLFFTSHISLIPIALAVAQFPCILIHEGFHALAGRRLGLPSTLGIGRRFYFLVAETRLDSLYSVPRRKRYLPFLAGVVADSVMVAGLTLACSLGRHWNAPVWISELALALAFTGILRILWQCLFYLETDLYFVIATAAGCTDLQAAARTRITNWVRARVGLAPRTDMGEWPDRDVAAGRWYAPLLVAGYALSLGTLLLVGVPTSIHFWTTVLHRIDGSQPQSLGEVVDTLFFVALSAAQFGLLVYVTARDIRGRIRNRSPRIERTQT